MKKETLMFLLVAINIQLSNGLQIPVDAESAEDVVHSMNFCDMEFVNLTCNNDVTTSEPRVILIKEAKYGRMELGRCIRTNFGLLGCFINVTQILDSKCSGFQECIFLLPNQAIPQPPTCPRDLKNYLRVDFSCILNRQD